MPLRGRSEPISPPIHDREQAIQVVQRATAMTRDRGVAERIIDALGIGQPDPDLEQEGLIERCCQAGQDTKLTRTLERAEKAEAEVERLETELYGEDGIRTGQIGHLNDAVRIQAERAERAEERLRAVEQAARNVDRAHESFRSSLPYQPPEAIYALYREKLALPLDALRAVLPEQEDE